MPLFMDFHIINDITVEEVKRAHIADLAVQDKYGVTYHQFWINEDAGSLFCLIEGPDKESCERVHREAHGNIACQIVKVESGFFKTLMGDSYTVDHGLVIGEKGEIDPANRFVLVIDIRGKTEARSITAINELALPDEPKKLVRRIIPVYQGRLIKSNDYVMAAFTEADSAISCAIEIRRQLVKKLDSSKNSNWNIQFKIGLAGGQPVTKRDEFFELTVQLAQRLCLIAGENDIVISSLVKKSCSFQDEINTLNPIHLSEEEFLKKLIDIAEEKMSDTDFNVEKLCHEIGISRPQLYRKVVSVTGKSPVQFIRKLKMNKALFLIREQNLNITEISLSVGYNNPSYFSKCFQDAYGVQPSHFLSN